jgi:hypothetical protein
MLPPYHQETELDWSELFRQGDTHIGPLWGLCPHDVDGRHFTDGAIEAIQELKIEDAPKNAFAARFNLFDLEWEDGDPTCSLSAGWLMKAQLLGYDFIPDDLEESQ